MKQILLAVATVAALFTTACNTSTDGANGYVTFTPSECGRFSCDFDDSIGVGGTIEVQITGLEGVSTAGADLVSDDPEFLSVTPIADRGQPTWELQALAAGVARLTVLDPDDAVLDFIEVPIQELTGLIAENVLGDAVGPADDASFDEVWKVNADEGVSFQITPAIGIDAPAMGKYVYTATIDAGLEDGLVDNNLSGGYLYFNVPAGQYAASFVNDFGHAIDLLIVAE